MTTEVMFRRLKWEHGDNIMALFPYEIENHNGDVMSYMHIGQHGSANYNHCIDSTIPATPDEYKDLLKELETIGYNLKIVKRRNYTKYLENCYVVYRRI